MKKIIPILIIVLIYSDLCVAQTDSVKWALSADSNAVAYGNVMGYAQTFSNLVIRSYSNATYQKLGPDLGGNWPAETAQNNTRYVQFAASPMSGYTFTITSISYQIGWSGTTGNMSANVYYSTDSTFVVKTQLGSTITLQNSSGDLISFPLTVPVNSGKTIYIRVYPWDKVTGTTKSLGLANFVIAGTTVLSGSPSIILNTLSLSFGITKVNTTKDLLVTISGTLLSPVNDSIRLIAPPGFGLSTISGSGFSSSVALPYSNATLKLDTVFVRFMPTSLGSYTGTIVVSGGGISNQSITVTGNSVPTSTILGIFVSPGGNDADSGTYTRPYLTIQKALSVVQPGDTIFLRAGIYANSTTINLSKSGTPSKRICLIAYPPDGSRPLLDFSSMSFSGSNRGVNLAGNYWYIKGLDIYRAGDNGMYTSGSYNIVEFCAFHENRDGGCQIGGGASYNQYINCDSYFNYDSTGVTSTAGGNADGFSPKLDVGTGNSFYGCRAWLNSDDGWDGFQETVNDDTTVLVNCWTWKNGYLKDGVTHYPSMNGNGFKMGGNGMVHNFIVKNCLSFNNYAKGYDQNNGTGSLTLLNCTAYKNNAGGGSSRDFSIPGAMAAGKQLILENCISYTNYVTTSGPSVKTIVSCSWTGGFTTPSASDFLSIDTTGISGPRKPDGSLPDVNFMHLMRGSQFIDAGTNVGLPFNGLAPDLGCFESNYPTSVASEAYAAPRSFQLLQNYPNPFNPSTMITYSVGTYCNTSLRVYDVLGREVAVLVDGVKSPGSYTVQWNAGQMPSGMYFLKLSGSGGEEIRKMVLMK